MNILRRLRVPVLYVVLSIYIVLLSDVLLFNYASPLEILTTHRYLVRDINLIPLHTIYGYLSGHLQVSTSVVTMNVFGNIVIFIPLGIFLILLGKDKRISRNIFIVFTISFLVEVVQYVLGLGSSDIDDVILNSTGGFIGILCYKALTSFFKQDKNNPTDSQQPG